MLERHCERGDEQLLVFDQLQLRAILQFRAHDVDAFGDDSGEHQRLHHDGGDDKLDAQRRKLRQ